MSIVQLRAPMTSPAVDLETLVRTHQVGLWRYLRALGAAPDLAEDLLQDTFLVAFRKLRSDGAAMAVASFLRQTARHLYLRRRRDEGRREELLAELAEGLWREDCAGDDGEGWLAALRGCVAGLDGKAAQVVQMFYGEGRDRAATAAALGLKESGAKTLLQRVRATLRACVEGRVRGER